MADVVATFTANIKPFQAAMGQMATAVKAGTGSTTTMSQKVGGAMASIGKGSLIAGAAVGAMAAKAISSYGSFQNSINQAAVIAGSSNKSLKGDMKDLEGVALSLGKTLPISAQDASNAMVEMARNGASVSDLKKVFPSIAKAAAVSGADLSMTATAVQQSMNIWGGGAKNAAKNSAILAKNANLSNAEVGQMGQAFANVGSTAATLGIGIKDTSTAIGLMSNHGLSAAQGSQDLAHALTLMARPTKVAKNEMNDLGISYTDSSGKFKKFPQILKEVSAATKGMSQSQKVAALTNLYGAAGAKAMLPLLIETEKKTKNGKSGWDNYSAALEKAGGSANKANKFLSDNSQNMTKNVGQSIDQMKDSWDALVKSSMSTIAPAVQNIANWFGNLATAIQKSNGPVATFVKSIIAFSPVIAAVAVGFGVLMIAIGKVVSSISTIWGALQKVGGAMCTLWTLAADNPLVALAIAIAAVVAGLIYFFTQTKTGRKLWANFVDWLKGAWEGLKGVASTVWSAIVGFFKGAVDKVKGAWSGITGFFSNLWSGIVSGASSIWDGITSAASAAVNVLKSVWGGITSFFSGLWNGIVSAATAVWNTFGPALTTIWNGIVEIARGVWEVLKSVIMGPILLVLDFLTGSWTQLGSDLQLIWQGIVDGASMIWNGLVTYFSGIWDAISTYASVVWNTLVSVLSGIWNLGVSGAQTIWNNLTGFFVGLWNGITSAASAAWNGIVSFLTGLWNGAVNTAKNIWNAIPGFFSGLWNGVKSLFSSAWNGITSIVSSACRNTVNTAKSIWSGFTNIVSTVVNGIKNGFNALRNFNLLDAGRAIMDSFFSGLKSAWGKVQDFVGGIASWIRKHKGPIQYDAKLLIPAGAAIMGGLNKGLERNFQSVQSTVSGMAGAISDKVNSVASSVDVNGLAIDGGEVAQSIDASERVQPTFVVQNELVGDKIRTMVHKGDKENQINGQFFR